MGRPAKDYTGQHFEKLTVIERVGSSSDGHAKWKCQCDCGKITEINSNQMYKIKSCGCETIKKAKQRGNLNRIKNITNQRFGKLIAIECIGGNGNSALWKCQCDCGNKNFITTSAHLISGNTKSCGCLKSQGENIIILILQSNNIIFEQQKTFKDCILSTGGLARYDFFLPEYNRLIEYDGYQHYFITGGWNNQENFQKVRQSDIEKNQYCIKHNIPLVRIPYTERDNITLQMLLGDQYLVKVGA